ncbi:hypothetical protein AURDEDRAFT_173649 [Auricularia subglabra TFB-10046 SS5]|nr:hypothetical protein AURDEDRAFT_173649 [Auricularia subglabra TFB-10046 SS5]
MPPKTKVKKSTTSSPPKRALSPGAVEVGDAPVSPTKRARVDEFGVMPVEKLTPRSVATREPAVASSFSDDEGAVVAQKSKTDDQVLSDNEGDGVFVTARGEPAGVRYETPKQPVRQTRVVAGDLLDVEAVEDNSPDNDEETISEDDGGPMVVADTTESDDESDIAVLARRFADDPQAFGRLTTLVKIVSSGRTPAPESHSPVPETPTRATASVSTKVPLTAPPPSRVSSVQPVPGGPPDPASNTAAQHVDDSRVSNRVTTNTQPATISQGMPPVNAGTQTQLPSDIDVDSRFDGKHSCLNAALWTPGLRTMYRTLVPPPRVVKYTGMADDAFVTAADFAPWRPHRLSGNMMHILQFVSNEHYVNVARVSHDAVDVFDTENFQYPMRFFARRGANQPALFVCLVEVRQSNLLNARSLRDGSEFEKRSIVATCFSQELDLVVSNIGSIEKADNIALPSWHTKNNMRGFSFQTRPSLIKSGSAVTARGSPSKRGNYTPSTRSAQKILPLLPANVRTHGLTVPVIDASERGFNVATSFADIRGMSDMDSEPPAGSVGVAFFTITDGGSPAEKIEFNVHAFAMLAKSPDAE